MFAMFANVSRITAACLAALTLLCSAHGHAADTAVAPPRLDGIWQQPWVALPKLELKPPSAARPLSVVPELTATQLPAAIDPAFAAWSTSHRRPRPLQLDLTDAPSTEEPSRDADLLSTLNLPAHVPPLIRYTDEATDVTLSIIPGSPCTGACLKLAGSF
jgi:hypothetical protein